MRLTEILLSEYGNLSSIPSPVNRMMASFADDFRQGKDINLGVGYVNERTIPRDLIVEATKQVLSQPDKYPAALNYGGSKGSRNLIGSIRRFYGENGIGGLTRAILDDREIIIGPNGATSLLEGIAHVMEPGIVITTDPMYYIYCNYLERRGFDLVAVPEDEEGIRADLLEKKTQVLGAKKNDIRFLYVVTVNNPTGTILSNRRRKDLVQFAGRLSQELGRIVPLFLDKAYEHLVHDPDVPPLMSGFHFDDYGLVYELGTLSKILAPALRIGYMMGKDGPFLRAMIQKTSDVGFSAPLLSQEITSYLLDHHVAGQVARVNEGYRDKARLVKGWIQEMLGGSITACSGGQAGFYFYLTFKDVDTFEGSPFFRYLTRTTGVSSVDGPPHDRKPRVIYIPGEYCVHSRGDMVTMGKRQLRLSYGFEEPDRIRDAISFMKEAVDYAQSSGD
ncbi:pyridoxal phosphate-dependent aminotransferase [bacterium]|nr:pyridoxal phosphate-dependent aminotransferase [bacterium]